METKGPKDAIQSPTVNNEIRNPDDEELRVRTLVGIGGFKKLNICTGRVEAKKEKEGKKEQIRKTKTMFRKIGGG